MNYANLEEAFAFYNNPEPEILEQPVMSQQIVESVVSPTVVSPTVVPRPLGQCSCCSDKSQFDINHAIIFLLLIIIFFKK